MAEASIEPVARKAETAGVPRLELRGITKRYPGVLANDGIGLNVAAGEVHALLGENGAGKSTLVKIIYGVIRPNAGEVLWEGRPVEINSPARARRLGIGMVFQQFSLFESLTVAENIALGIDERIPMRDLVDRIGEVARRYALTLDPSRHIHSLSVGERQRVEILRCLLQDPKLLIMDEPTSVLTPQEVERLFETLRRLAGEGRTVLYISHKLDEIRALCDRATVLRTGRVVATCDPRAETVGSLAQMMIGGELSTPHRAARADTGADRLTVDRLSLASNHPFGTDIRDVSFAVRSGEIMGIAGVAGNGQTELLAALSGERACERDDAVRIGNRPVGRLGPRARRRLGLAFVPEERLGRGAVAEMSLADNTLLSASHRERLVRHGLIRLALTRDFAERICEAFNVVATGASAEAKSLSGGNLQKFIIGREILQKPGLLIAAHPTWGVDAGAAAAIHRALIELANDGAAVLVVSEDLDELFAISDRIAVIGNGRLSASRPTRETSEEEIGLLMGGLLGTAEGGAVDDAA
ncbi:MAG: ABC transporter ATP-binding protein [Alphaproteobacteria bacterium]